MRKIVTGEQIAQLTNPDPFAVPTWRAPVYRTPGWIIALVQLFRFLVWLARLIIRHPVTDAVLAVLVLVWLNAGWPGLVVLACRRHDRPGGVAVGAPGLVQPVDRYPGAGQAAGLVLTGAGGAR